MLHVVPAFARIGEENAFAVLARATDLQRQGRDIVKLGIGQPKSAEGAAPVADLAERRPA